MKQKKTIGLWFVLGAVITIIVSALLVVAFYSMSYMKLNDMLKLATTRNADEFIDGEDSRFAYDHLISLKITDDKIGENEHVEYKTKNKISAISLGYIQYTLQINARIVDWDTWEEKNQYSGTRTVALRFDTKQFQWVVESVT